MSHIWMSHVTHMSDSYHIRTWHVTHMRHVTHMSKSCHAHECVMSHTWVSHIAHTNTSCPTYAWVTSHIRMTCRIRTRHSCHTFERVTSRIFKRLSKFPRDSKTYRRVSAHGVAVSCSELQCVAVSCTSHWEASQFPYSTQTSQHSFRCSELQCVAVRCSELQCVAVSCSVLQWVAVCCSEQYALSRSFPPLSQGNPPRWRVRARYFLVSLSSLVFQFTYHPRAFQIFRGAQTNHRWLCCSKLQCVAVRCGELYVPSRGFSICLEGSLPRRISARYFFDHTPNCVAVRCSLLQCVAVCCSGFQRVAVCCSALYGPFSTRQTLLQWVAVSCSVLWCVAVCFSVLHSVAVCCSVLNILSNTHHTGRHSRKSAF